ncbi:12135_t:CDS:2 [Funneliformis caledonium]|uniref:12135_t:CDS:1 n=1 Tax=Funneliformis caledonium TaxID=1117310 RepID=A0A9N9GLL5_9GLOM|nr:12135_t:CDS:2 [Funneliformis caledonium]
MDHITALENKNEELEYNARRPSKKKDLDKKHKIHKKLYTKYQESSSERSSSKYESDEVFYITEFFDNE